MCRGVKWVRAAVLVLVACASCWLSGCCEKLCASFWCSHAFVSFVLPCSDVRGSPVWPFQKANNYFCVVPFIPGPSQVNPIICVRTKAVSVNPCPDSLDIARARIVSRLSIQPVNLLSARVGPFVGVQRQRQARAPAQTRPNQASQTIYTRPNRTARR